MSAVAGSCVSVPELDQSAAACGLREASAAAAVAGWQQGWCALQPMASLSDPEREEEEVDRTLSKHVVECHHGGENCKSPPPMNVAGGAM